MIESDKLEYRKVPCETCDGTGKIHSHNDQCYTCRGSGMVDILQIPKVPESIMFKRENDMDYFLTPQGNWDFIENLVYRNKLTGHLWAKVIGSVAAMEWQRKSKSLRNTEKPVIRREIDHDDEWGPGYYDVTTYPQFEEARHISEEWTKWMLTMLEALKKNKETESKTEV